MGKVCTATRLEHARIYTFVVKVYTKAAHTPRLTLALRHSLCRPSYFLRWFSTSAAICTCVILCDLTEIISTIQLHAGCW